MIKRLWALPAILVLSAGFGMHGETPGTDQENIEFVCMKTHKASNTCHFNFKVDGANYRYLDIGCKYSKKQDDLVKKVKEGELFLAKDWKIECPAPKEKPQDGGL